MHDPFDYPSHPCELSQQSQHLLAGVARAQRPEFWEQSLESARQFYDVSSRFFDHAPQEVDRIQDIEIPTRDGASINARLFRGIGASEHQSPTLLFSHGGGFVLGSIEGYEGICRYLANQLDAVVISLDYRLAPEYVFPTAANDVQDAYLWLAKHAVYLGLDSATFIAIGDSAGAQLAAQACIALRNQDITIAGQVLIYPSVSAYKSTLSREAYAQQAILNKKTIDWFMANYLQDTDYHDPRMELLSAPDLSGLAPSLFILAQCDPLVDEGIEYAYALKAADNEVSLSVYSGMLHTFFMMSHIFPQARQAQQQVIDWIKARWELV